MDVFAGPNFVEQRGVWRSVKIQHRKRSAAGLISTERHRGNIYAVITKQIADSSNHPRPVRVFEHEHDAVRTCFHGSAVDADNSRSSAKKRAADRHSFSFADSG